MLQKKTPYHNYLQLVPKNLRKDLLAPTIQDPKLKVAYLVFLDMLHLLKM